MSLAEDFCTILGQCEQKEGHTLPPSMKLRIANCMSRAVEKALLVGWYKDDVPDVTAVNVSVLRAAERAAVDT